MDEAAAGTLEATTHGHRSTTSLRAAKSALTLPRRNIYDKCTRLEDREASNGGLRGRKGEDKMRPHVAKSASTRKGSRQTYR